MSDFESTAVYQRRVEAAADTIQGAWQDQPEILIVLGSGLGPLADAVTKPVILPYTSIPGFPQATVPGHEGRLILGWLQEQPVAVMQGRFHYYEGHSMQDVVFPIRVMQQLDIKKLILTNAAGGTRDDMHPGDLMVITDHIGMLSESPLRGPNLDRFGTRFPDQTHVYDPAWIERAQMCAKRLGIRLHSGVYAWSRGPQFETPAEVRLLKMLGADALGMSTVPEAITASHGGMKVLGLSCITNYAAGLSDQSLSHEEVMIVGKQAAEQTIQLLSAILDRSPEG
jgi:purine-nucleoside phosphorylase